MKIKKTKKVDLGEKVNYEEIDTIVGPDITFMGNIVSGGSVRYEGNLKGTITLKGNLIIGRNGYITGDIEAKNIQIMGTVEGNVKCNFLKIASTGKLTGDTEVEKISIDEGAVFIGGCTIIERNMESPNINDILKSVEE